MTILVPPNAAFENDASLLRFSLDDQAWLGHHLHLVLYHFIAGEFSAEELLRNATRTSFETISFFDQINIVNNRFGGVRQQAGIIQPDVYTTTGAIQVIDRLLIPETYFLGLLDVLGDMPEYSIFWELLTLAEFQFLNVLGPYTVLAPTNDAWDSGLLTFMRNSENRAAMQYVLLNHIVASNVYGPATDAGGFVVNSLASQTLFFWYHALSEADGDGVAMVNKASLLNDTFVNLAGNGVVYGVRSVLLPASLADVVQDFGRYNLGGSLSILTQAFAQTGLLDSTIQQGGPLTLFAPPDESFRSLGDGLIEKYLETPWMNHLTLILNNHLTPERLNSTELSERFVVSMLSGTVVAVSFDQTSNVNSVGNIPVVFANVRASNRFLHIVGGVILPPPITTTFLTAMSALPQFTMLVSLINQAGLDMDLNDPLGGPLTIFAPTNEALELANLESLSPADLANTLMYHAIDQNLLVGDFGTGGMYLSSFGNETLNVTVSGDNVTLNEEARIDGTLRNQFVCEYSLLFFLLQHEMACAWFVH